MYSVNLYTFVKRIGQEFGSAQPIQDTEIRCTAAGMLHDEELMFDEFFRVGERLETPYHQKFYVRR